MTSTTKLAPATLPEFDVVVIGGGPGGYISAVHCAELGLRVALVERERMGGVSLGWGCIPTKAMLRYATIVDALRCEKIPGIRISGLTVDYAAVHKHSRDIADRLVMDVNRLLLDNNITVYRGHAMLAGATDVEVETMDALYKLRAKNIILATGTSAANSPLAAYGAHILTYREALDRPVLPDPLIVVGAGPVGLECATIFAAYNRETLLFESSDRVLPNEDHDISAAMAEALSKSSVKLHTSCEILPTSVHPDEPVGRRVALSVRNTVSGELRVHYAEAVMLAFGHVPNTRDLGLEKAGVVTDEHGYIVTDEYLCTNVPGIYAVGDVTGKPALASVAEAQAHYVAMQVSHGEGLRMPGNLAPVYANIPHYIYSSPQVAGVGLTETQAIARGREINIRRMPFKTSLAMNRSSNSFDGFVKVISDLDTDRVLGVHMIGPNVTELLPQLAFHGGHGVRADDLMHAIQSQAGLRDPLRHALRELEGLELHGG